MKIVYNVTGSARQALVAAISKEMNLPRKYLGTPSYAYEVGEYNVSQDGTLTGPDNADLVAALADFKAEATEYDAPAVEPTQAADEPLRRYQAELSDPDCPDRMEVFVADDDADAIRQALAYCEGEVRLLELHELDENYDKARYIDLAPPPTIDNPERQTMTISVPLAGFTPEKLDNLTAIVEAKALLLKKVFGTDDLRTVIEGDQLQFPWFPASNSADANAYAQFVAQLCWVAKKNTRVAMKAPEVFENERFSMRAFIVNVLKMKGEEYKHARALLLTGLSGNSAFRFVASHDRWKEKHSARRVAAE
jgi:hypothetical protein